MKTKIFLILLIFIPPIGFPQAIASSEIYKYVDKDGNITFTNRRIPNAEKISIASFSRNTKSSQSKPSSNLNFPRVTDTTQKGRDVMRREILQKELITEEKLFSEAQNFLDEIRSKPEFKNNSQEKTVQLQNKLLLHQRNVATLKKELNR
ncbi:MAG: DUF4124 domain-containing protein [Nitrosomonas sp.]|uniref:DUF4124 domain-containing protein n=1 Tax=Nitrosomonas sp. TaxID=42353 RepID=UPI0025FA413C|nr:DUF4124 domain-containing protein [Nitrosomonas sp.]MBY0475611.1 DUF4124 domain-containing protein [Nitrosomonas sp.]